MRGRDARSVSKEKGDAATYIRLLRLAADQWRVTMVQPRRDSKVATWYRRKPPKLRSCFHFRIKGLWDSVRIYVDAVSKPCRCGVSV